MADIDFDAVDQTSTIETWLDRAAGQLEAMCNTAFAWLDPGAIVIVDTLPSAVLQALAGRLHRPDRA